MKSPFAVSETVKFTYPEPFGTNDTRIDGEVLKAIEEGETAPWVVLRVPHSTGDNDKIAEWTQLAVEQATVEGEGNTLKMQIVSANQRVFVLLAEEWSFATGKPSASDYEKLSTWAGAWVTACLKAAMDKGTAIAPKAPSTPPSSKKPVASRGRSSAVKE